MWSLNILVLLCVWSLRFGSVEAADNDFDFLVYTQHWPATFCKSWMDKNPTHKCILPKKPDIWAIHGIWPNKFGPLEPEFCNRTWLFDPQEIRPIESELEQEWINIESGTPIYELWAHEWNKHGTCAAALEPFNSQIKYFSKGLEWLQEYTMSTILSEANIQPSDTNTYTVQDFYKAIKDKLGVDPEIECKSIKGKQYVFELRICFTKSLELMDCQSTVHSNFEGIITNCNNKGILYVESVKPPNRALVQLYRFTTWLQWLTL